MKTGDARSLPSVTQEALRLKAIRAISGGMKQVEVAKLFGVTRQAVGKWVRAYRQGGEKALKRRRRGRPKGGSLLPWQAAQTAKMVVDHYPEQLKLPFYLWTREAVAQLIKRRFGVQVSVWTIGRYLNRWGFTPQKPIRKAFEQNPQAVRHWLQQAYPGIVKRAKSEKALIYWGDEMGLRSDHAAGRCFGRKGVTPVIPGSGQRFGCNMISAITNKGTLHFMVMKEHFKADIFKEFLVRLVKQSKQKVFLIVDRHPVHRSAKVKQWLEDNGAHIRMFFLPSYSPELNPDELLNQDVKTNAVGRRRVRQQQELMRNVRSYLRSRQRQPHIVRSYFHEEHVRYAAE